MSFNDRTLDRSREVTNSESVIERTMLLHKHRKIVSGATIEAVIGEGEFGIVYRGREIESGKKIAIKIVNFYNENGMEAVLQEAMMHSTLKHKHIVELLTGYISIPDTSLIMHMEYFEGVHLSQFIADEQFNGKRHQVKSNILEGMKSAIQYMEDQKVTHGDLHSENVLVNLDGDVKIIDFGFAVKRECKQDGDGDSFSCLKSLVENMPP